MVIPVKPAFLFEHFRNVKIYARRFKPVFNQTKLIRSKTWIVQHLKWNSGIHFRIDWRKKCWIHAQHFILICFGRMWRIPGKNVTNLEEKNIHTKCACNVLKSFYYKLHYTKGTHISIHFVIYWVGFVWLCLIPSTKRHSA